MKIKLAMQLALSNPKILQDKDNKEYFDHWKERAKDLNQVRLCFVCCFGEIIALSL